MAALLGLRTPDVGKLVGRVLMEAMPNRELLKWRTLFQMSEPDAAGRRTIVQTQLLGDTRYFDAAGYQDRTVGLAVPGSLRLVAE
jgi:hypothetical protein